MSVLIKLDADRKPYVAAGEATKVVIAKPVVADGGRGDARLATYVKKPAGEKVEKDWRAEGFAPLGDWLAGERDLPPVLVATDDPLSLEGRLEGVSLIAIEFAKFNDGRGLSSAVLLRKRLGYGGEVRAVGDVAFHLHGREARARVHGRVERREGLHRLFVEDLAGGVNFLRDGVAFGGEWIGHFSSCFARETITFRNAPPQTKTSRSGGPGRFS